MEEIKPDKEAKAVEVAETMIRLQRRNFDQVAYLFAGADLRRSDDLPAPSCLSRNARQDLGPCERHVDTSF